MKIFMILSILGVMACTAKPRDAHLRNLYPDLALQARSDQPLAAMPANPGAEVVRLKIGRLDLEVNAKNFQEEKFAEFKNGRQAYFQNLHATNRSPYPGFVSQEVVCSPEMQPHFMSETPLRLRVELSANARHVFGVCSKEGQELFATVLYLFCTKTSRLYQFKVFAERAAAEEAKNFVQDLDCDGPR